LPRWTSPYEAEPGTFDEAIRPDGAPRYGYEPLIGAILDSPPRAALESIRRNLSLNGVEFGREGVAFEVDPLPRLITAEEWPLLEAGLAQRVRALNRYLADIYGDRKIVEAGIVPARVPGESIQFEPMMRDAGQPVVAHIAGPDLIRDTDGGFMVLEDNLRTPSGLAYLTAARAAVTAGPHLPELPAIGVGGAFDLLARTIRGADPSGRGDPAIAILSDGPVSGAWYEHREISRRLGAPLVTPDRLSVHGNRLIARNDDGGPPVEVEVLYNRSSAESLRDRDGALTDLGELLAGPLVAGTLACVNSFGTGVADDKAAHCYVERMIEFYLGEVPLLPSVPGHDLGEREVLDKVIGRLGELVIKPRWSFGGKGIVFGSEATPDRLRDLEAELRRHPAGYVAQEPVTLSTHPTVAGNRLEPRHLDLRPFVFTDGDEVTVLPGALSRFAGERGDMVVNSTQGGGAKDTWVLR
jgi:uncharacterized circularly permuted ATP-grasp superfamily protein